MKKHKKLSRKQKNILIISGVFLFAVILSAVFFVVFRRAKEEPASPVTEESQKTAPAPKYYSKLSGEEIQQGEDEAPIYCVQIPNGLDGARPQVGLHQAKVVFEAIAEAGITRFAAVFQNPQGSAIGPIRSLRSYYLDWDTPFGCTVVHAGGSDDAIAALRAGGYLELDESYDYTWRNYSDFIAPNNLFTAPKLLQAHSSANGYTAAKYTAWPRLTPEKDNHEDEPKAEDSTEKDASVAPAKASSIRLTYGGYVDFDPVYTYDEQSASYLRSYASGAPHQAYSCPEGMSDPVFSRDCSLSQLAPKVVVAIKVSEWLDSDWYHHVIKTVGSGEAYIFQNGTVIPATWSKASQADQIVFTDKDGKEVKLAPGQLWISVIPQTGSVTYSE